MGSRLSSRCNIEVNKLERETRPLLYFCFLLSVIFHASLTIFVRIPSSYSEYELKSLPVALHQPSRPRPPVIIHNFRGNIGNREYIFRHEPTTAVLPSGVELSQPSKEVVLSEFDWKKKSKEILGNIELPLLSFPIVDHKEKNTGIKTLDPDLGIEMAISGGKAEFLVGAERTSLFGTINLAMAKSKNLPSPVQAEQTLEKIASLLNQYTRLKVNTDPPVLLEETEFFSYPVIYLPAGIGTHLTPEEIRNLEIYVKEKRGFVIINNLCTDSHRSAVGDSLKMFVFRALDPPPNSPGQRLTSFLIPYSTDPLYSCWLDVKPVKGVEIIKYDRRSVGLYIDNDYSGETQEIKKNTDLLLVNAFVYPVCRSSGWLENKTRRSYYDPKTKTYTEWYSNGKIEFLARDWGLSEGSWIPSDSYRLFFDHAMNKYLFGQNDDYLNTIKKRNIFSETDPVKKPAWLICWKDYAFLEGWYPDGSRRFVYDYNKRTWEER